MKEDIVNHRAQSYENIYNILTDNVKKAKENLQHLAKDDNQEDIDRETEERIVKQKNEFEALLKVYMKETKSKESKITVDQKKIEH